MGHSRPNCNPKLESGMGLSRLNFSPKLETILRSYVYLADVLPNKSNITIFLPSFIIIISLYTNQVNKLRAILYIQCSLITYVIDITCYFMIIYYFVYNMLFVKSEAEEPTETEDKYHHVIHLFEKIFSKK